jgi:hypothetical protein
LLPWLNKNQNFLSQIDYNTAHYLETNLEEVDRSATPVIKRSQIPGNDGTQFAYNTDGENTAANDWLTCVSKKTGLSRVFLSMLLFMSAMMMIWLCLTAMVTAPEQRVHANNQVNKTENKFIVYGISNLF